MMKKQLGKILMLALVGVMIILSGCLAPQMTYQGRLTDAGGNPLNGEYRMRLRLYDDDESGELIYTDSQMVQVEDGFFDVVVGPETASAGIAPEDLAQPLWLEVEVADGVYTETLTPRQRLYGAPYAFTLMPGAVISGAVDSTLYGSSGVEAVLSVGNSYETSSQTNPALPALRIEAEKGIELSGFPDEMGGGIDGTIYSDLSDASSDLLFYSQDDVFLQVDTDDDESGVFTVVAGNEQYICTMSESGDLQCRGTITGNAMRTVAEVQGKQRALYGVQSPEAWREDFGTARLRDGAAFVSLESLFAAAIDAEDGDYHVFLTPLGETNGLYVAKKGPTGFEVREQGAGASNIAFDYRVVARPAGHEGERMPLVAPSTQIEGGGMR